MDTVINSVFSNMIVLCRVNSLFSGQNQSSGNNNHLITFYRSLYKAKNPFAKSNSGAIDFFINKGYKKTLAHPGNFKLWGDFLVNYYDVLGINQDCSLNDIKASFRRKAKEIHPDLQKEDSSEEMMLLLQAYKILSNPMKRREYDRSLGGGFRKKEKFIFNYREFLKGRRDDFHSQSKLIFYDLLNSNTDEALDLYEELISDEEFNMEKNLDKGDYLECVFLLAEEFENRGEYVRAFEFLKKLYNNEQVTPFFKHFIEEIIDRMKNVVCFKMVGLLSPELTMKHLNELVQFNFSKKDNAFFYKKMAEVSLKGGNKEDALRYLNLGLQNYKRLSGIKKLKERIGI